MEKIKVGHIGTRHDHSRAKLEAIKKFPHLFEVVGIVPEDEKVAERIKNDAVYGGAIRSRSTLEIFPERRVASG